MNGILEQKAKTGWPGCAKSKKAGPVRDSSPEMGWRFAAKGIIGTQNELILRFGAIGF